MTYNKIEKQDDAASSVADEEDYLSLTEVDESDKSWEPAQRKKGLRSKANLHIKRAKKFRWLIDMTLILINISLSFLLLRDFRRENSSSTIQIGSDFTGNGPDFPTKIVKFNADESFVPKNTSEFFSDEVLARWNTMMPGKRGLHYLCDILLTFTQLAQDGTA
jgi:hypothetical protein